MYAEAVARKAQAVPNGDALQGLMMSELVLVFRIKACGNRQLRWIYGCIVD